MNGPLSTTMGDSEMSQRAASGAAARQVETIGLAATHLHGDAYEIQIRGHRLTVDQPVEAGGANLGPTPTELFAASLAACVGFYAGRFLRRHGLAAEGLRVHCEATMSGGRPARVEAISLRLDGLPMLADRQRVALLAVVEHCTVHNSIRQAPEVKVELASGQPAAIGPVADRPSDS
jgi:putative redox protein